MTGKIIGYSRVSTYEQNADRQLDGMEFAERLKTQHLVKIQLDLNEQKCFYLLREEML